MGITRTDFNAKFGEGQCASPTKNPKDVARPPLCITTEAEEELKKAKAGTCYCYQKSSPSTKNCGLSSRESTWSRCARNTAGWTLKPFKSNPTHPGDNNGGTLKCCPSERKKGWLLRRGESDLDVPKLPRKARMNTQECDPCKQSRYSIFSISSLLVKNG